MCEGGGGAVAGSQINFKWGQWGSSFPFGTFLLLLLLPSGRRRYNVTTVEPSILASVVMIGSLDPIEGSDSDFCEYCSSRARAILLVYSTNAVTLYLTEVGTEGPG